MAKIFDYKGFDQLSLGRELNINDIRVIPCTIDAGSEKVVGGDLLLHGSKAQYYKKAAGAFTAADVAGIMLATNIKLNNVFPGTDGKVEFLPGQAGGCAVGGSVAVKLEGTAPAEGAKVYYNVTSGAFTAATSGIELTNMRFTGITEGNVTAVNILYR